MSGKFWTPAEIDRLHQIARQETVDWDTITTELGRTRHSIQLKMRAMGLKMQAFYGGVGFTVEPPPTPNRGIAELMEQQAKAFQQKQGRHEKKQKGITIELDEPGPYALALFGDPHVGDDGTDLEYLAYCMEFVRNTPRCYAVNIGDLTNNWVGRLARLYAHQHTTDDEEIRLCEWLIESLPWMWVILGNHDKFGPIAEMVCRNAGVMHVSHGAKFKIKCGSSEFVVDARHDHKGRSQYNPAFGQMKQQYRGSDANLIVGGHIHNGAYSLVRNGVSGRIGHCVRLGAFKKWDDYADANGFTPDSIGPICMAVVDPSKDPNDIGFVTVFWDLDHGAAFLEVLRKKEEKPA